jgi:hypothetical protein
MVDAQLCLWTQPVPHNENRLSGNQGVTQSFTYTKGITLVRFW